MNRRSDAVRDDGRLRGQLPCLLDVVGELARLDLARLDVGLVERVDAHHRACHGRGNLPAEELARQRVDVGHVDPHDGPPGGYQRLDGRILGVVGRGRESKVDEQAVGPVRGRRAEGLAVDGDNGVAVLSGRLGNQLLEPRAQVVDARRDDGRELVDAQPGAGSHHQTERDSGIGLDSRLGTLRGHRRGAADPAREVQAHRRGRHEAERRQGRVPAADRGHAGEDAPEAVAPGRGFELRSGIGDRHEVPRRLRRADCGDHALEEVGAEDVGLEGRARLAGDDRPASTRA